MKEQRAERRRILVRSAESRSQASPTASNQVGTTWQYQYFALKGEGEPVAASPASQGFLPEGGRDRVVGHLDDQLQGQTSQLHVHVDELHHQPKANAEVAEYFGEAPAQEKACDETANPNFCTEYHAEEPGVLEAGLLLGDAAGRMRQRRRTTAWTTTTGSKPGPKSKARPVAVDSVAMATEAVVVKRSAGRRLAGLFHGRPRLQVGSLLAAPMAWLVVLYLGSLVVLLITAFWTVDPLSGEVIKELQPRKLRSTGQRTGLPGDRLADGPHGGPGHPHRRDHRLPDRLLHGQGGEPARQGAAGRRGADAALVQLPGQGPRLADDALRRRGASTGRSTRSACTARATA